MGRWGLPEVDLELWAASTLAEESRQLPIRLCQNSQLTLWVSELLQLKQVQEKEREREKGNKRRRKAVTFDLQFPRKWRGISGGWRERNELWVEKRERRNRGIVGRETQEKNGNTQLGWKEHIFLDSPMNADWRQTLTLEEARRAWTRGNDASSKDRFVNYGGCPLEFPKLPPSCLFLFLRNHRFLVI